MKKHIIYLFVSFAFCFGCKEEFIGQYPTDNVPPKNVTNVSVQNIAGGAILTYNLPEEDDLLCITAIYTLPDGRTKEMSSSAYSNNITLKGFGKSAKSTVKLIAVDKSHNNSEPVLVEIEPLDSPVYDVMKTFKVYESFGGLEFDWENPLEEDIVFGTMIKNEEGEYKHAGTIYSSQAIVDKASIRGLEDVPTEFAFYFRDTYNNYTDTLFTSLTPYFEAELDKSKFVEMKLSNKFKPHGYSKGMKAMWNNNYNVDTDVFYINISDEEPYFSFDLGVEVKLSRFQLWQRRNFLFGLHNPRYFEIWGTTDVSKTTDPDNWEGWVKIMDCESKRPSGLDGGVAATAEDEAYALAGEEFKVPVDAPKIRYIRFWVHSSWTGTKAVHINELTFYGDNKQKAE